MTPDTWLKRWQDGRTGFHNDHVHPDLIAYISDLLPQTGSVLVPLCGKTLDLGWLVEQGHSVHGVELSDIAARQYHEAAGIVPQVAEDGPVSVWRSPGLSFCVGDFFDLPIGRFDAVWDRASMIALPPQMRERYTARLVQHLRPGGRLLLNCLTYDLVRDQPPFSITDEEVRRHYGAHGELVKLADDDQLPEEPRWVKEGMTVLRRKLWMLTRS